MNCPVAFWPCAQEILILVSFLDEGEVDTRGSVKNMLTQRDLSLRLKLDS